MRRLIGGLAAQTQAGMGAGDDSAKPGEAPGPVRVGERRDPARVDLGWCGGSTVQPKKQRVIQGVGTASLVTLQAQLYAAQEAGTAAGGAAPSRARATKDALGSANPGVLDRIARDAAAAAATTDVHGALERKAALYDQLAREGVTDPRDERFEVDFFFKARFVHCQGLPRHALTPSLAARHTLG